MLHRFVALLILLCSLTGSSTASAATPEQIATALEKAKKFVYDNQTNGNWEAVQQQDPKAFGADIKGPQFTGQTALCAWALICAGESPDEPHIAKAIDFVKKTPANGIYALSTRCLLWSSLKLDRETRTVAYNDLNAILKAQRRFGAAAGLYHYTAPLDPHDPDHDHSVSQFAVLAA